MFPGKVEILKVSRTPMELLGGYMLVTDWSQKLGDTGFYCKFANRLSC